jgi:hypothetical protein
MNKSDPYGIKVLKRDWRQIWLEISKTSSLNRFLFLCIEIRSINVLLTEMEDNFHFLRRRPSVKSKGILEGHIQQKNISLMLQRKGNRENRNCRRFSIRRWDYSNELRQLTLQVRAVCWAIFTAGFGSARTSVQLEFHFTIISMVLNDDWACQRGKDKCTKSCWLPHFNMFIGGLLH